LVFQQFSAVLFTDAQLAVIDDVSLSAGKFGIKENAKEPVQFRTAKNVGLIAGGTGKEVITIPRVKCSRRCDMTTVQKIKDYSLVY